MDILGELSSFVELREEETRRYRLIQERQHQDRELRTLKHKAGTIKKNTIIEQRAQNGQPILISDRLLTNILVDASSEIKGLVRFHRQRATHRSISSGVER